MIPDRTEQLEKLHLEHIVRPAESQKTNGHLRTASTVLTDEEVLALCRKARNAPKFENLYDRGDLTDYDGDESRADQAFMSMLAFYTQDVDQLDSLFRGSALYRPEKWGKRADYRRRTIEKALGNLAETYGSKAVAHDGTNGHGSLSSQRPNLYRSRTLERKPAVLRLAKVERPGPRRYRWAGLVPFAYPTLIFGAGGVAKSLLALALAAMLALGRGRWLGRALEGGPVLYLDFELDAEEMARRVWQVCEGAGFAEPPGDLFYLSAAGYKVEEAFEAALEACRELGIVLIVIDSLGPALQGDAEAARDTIGFFSRYIDPFKAAGVTPLIIDHQSKVQAGQSYQGKEAFGSVYKTNLARSVIQVEATERAEGTLTVRLRQKKHNFGPLAAPFGVKLTYTEEAVTIDTVELGAAELAEEATLTAPERVKLALAGGPKFPSEIAETTGVPLKTVGNTLTALRKQGIVEATGEKEGRAEQVRLIVPTSQPYRNRTWDDGATSAELHINERGEAEF